MNAMAADSASANDNEGGPMWGRFFDSIGHDDDGSVLSGSHATGSAYPTTPGSMRIASPQSEVHPNDSASVVDDEGWELCGADDIPPSGLVLFCFASLCSRARDRVNSVRRSGQGSAALRRPSVPTRTPKHPRCE